MHGMYDPTRAQIAEAARREQAIARLTALTGWDAPAPVAAARIVARRRALSFEDAAALIADMHRDGTFEQRRAWLGLGRE